MTVLEKHSRMPRKYLATGEDQPRDEGTGQFQGFPAEKKAEILKTALARIAQGVDDLDTIAAELQISPPTLDRWLAGLGDEYRAVRRAWIDGKLADTEHLMKTAPNPLELARGRDLGKRAEWLAARIDPERYMEKREVTVKKDEPTDPEAIRERISDLEAKLGLRVIEHEKTEGKSEVP